MLNDNALKVIAALRSGEFEQGFWALRKDDRYCPLGVICEVFRRETGRGEWVPAPYETHAFHFNGRTGILPSEVREWIEFRSHSGAFRRSGDAMDLTKLNDKLKFGLPQIADVIESEPEGLFT